MHKNVVERSVYSVEESVYNIVLKRGFEFWFLRNVMHN